MPGTPGIKQVFAKESSDAPNPRELSQGTGHPAPVGLKMGTWVAMAKEETSLHSLAVSPAPGRGQGAENSGCQPGW